LRHARNNNRDEKQRQQQANAIHFTTSKIDNAWRLLVNRQAYVVTNFR
jgi:hypothetical protein